MNRKGYMLIEIVLASVLAFGVVYFIINMTIKLKNKNDDSLVMTQVSTDQAIVTNKFMSYFIEEEDKFDCSRIEIINNIITYKGELIDIFDDYAKVSDNFLCTNNNGTISIKIPVEVVQLKNKDYDIDIDYKYLIGDLSNPQLSVSVPDGKVYSKSKTGTIKISDNEGLLNGNYRIKYEWSSEYLTCDKLSNTFDFNVRNNEKEVSKTIVINNQTGAGRLYACNETIIYDIYGNELPSNILTNASMYLDNEAPIITKGNTSINSTITIPLTVTDKVSGINYSSFTKSDIKITIGNSDLYNFELKNNNNDNYSVVINNNSLSGDVYIKINSNSLFDKASNGNNEFNEKVYTICPKDYYSNDAKTECIKCPDGYFTDSPGQTSKRACKINCPYNKRVDSANAKCTSTCGDNTYLNAHTVIAGDTSPGCSPTYVKVYLSANGGNVKYETRINENPWDNHKIGEVNHFKSENTDVDGKNFSLIYNSKKDAGSSKFGNYYLITWTLKSNQAINNTTLQDYNNTQLVYITRNGYYVPRGKEWICLTDNCKGQTFDQTKVGYKGSDFCKGLKTGNCNVVLGVNWKK